MTSYEQRFSNSLTRVLDALDRTLPHMTSLDLPFPEGEWPTSMCQIASKVAGHFLAETGHGGWMLVIRQNHRFHGHAWLERGDSFYDPTGHQFPGIDVPLRGMSPNPLGETFTNETCRQPVEGLDDDAHRALREALRPILDHQLSWR